MSSGRNQSEESGSQLSRRSLLAAGATLPVLAMAAPAEAQSSRGGCQNLGLRMSMPASARIFSGASDPPDDHVRDSP